MTKCMVQIKKVKHRLSFISKHFTIYDLINEEKIRLRMVSSGCAKWNKTWPNLYGQIFLWQQKLLVMSINEVLFESTTFLISLF